MVGVRERKTKEPAERERGLQSLWRYLGFSRPYWFWLVIASVTGLVRMVPNLFLPWFVGRVIDRVLGARGGHGDLSVLWPMVLAFVGIMLLHIPSSLGRLYGAQIAATSAIRDIRFQLFDRLQHLSLAFHNTRPTGAIVSRLMNDVATAQNIFDILFIQALQQLLIACTITVYLFTRDWQWALICFAALPVYLITTKLVRRPLRQASRATLESTSQITGYVQERLSMIREVQAFTAETHEKRRVRREVEGLRKYSLRQHMLNTLLITASEVTRYSGSVIIVIYGVYRVLHGGATPGDVTTFFLYQQQLLGPLEWFSNMYATLNTAEVAAERIFDFFDTEPLVQDAPNAKRLLCRRPPAVQVDGISFTYPGSRQTVLQDVSFTAEPGTRVVLVGESGAGKSTLMSILPRFYDVQQGSIRIDGQDLRAVTLHSLRRAVGIVPQEPVLFSGTIWENILYGRRDAPEADVRAAAQAANAHDFIMELPDGYNTLVGERGVGLSGGQIQRIAIARAFLKDSPILILDEATSNLDAVSESLVLEAIDRLSSGRTTFIIAHRLSVARTADLILVLDNGRIIERGTHEALLAIKGAYYGLWQRQMLAQV